VKLLLDTHLILWVAQDSPKLSITARNLINDPHNELFFSSVSLWEIAIKNGLGRKNFKVNIPDLWRGLVANDYTELAMRSEHTLAIEDLPPHHKDPFDRILVAQILVEGITLLTSDTRLTTYSGSIRHV